MTTRGDRRSAQQIQWRSVTLDRVGEIAMYPRRDAPEIGHATTAILVSLMEVLREKKILSNAEIRAVLTKAAGRLEPPNTRCP